MEAVRKIAKIIVFWIKYVFSKAGNPNGIKIKGSGKKSQCSRSSEIKCHKNSKITVGRINLFPNVHVAAIDGGEISLGDNVFINRNCIFVAKESISVGNNCSFGPNVCVYDHDHAFGRAKQNGEKFRCKPISIGDGCWIGANVTILKGTQIGDNCVIGAGCVVSGTIPANTLVKADRSFSTEPIE